MGVHVQSLRSVPNTSGQVTIVGGRLIKNETSQATKIIESALPDVAKLLK